MFDKQELLKVAQEVREHGITTKAHKELVKKAQITKIAAIIAKMNTLK
jgi:hypothetical protein